LEFKQTVYQVLSKELNTGKSGLKSIIDKTGTEVAIEISKSVLRDRLEMLKTRIVDQSSERKALLTVQIYNKIFSEE
jgi:hypothetical protein